MKECVMPCWWGEGVWIIFVGVAVGGCCGLVRALRIDQFLFIGLICHVVICDLSAAVSILRRYERRGVDSVDIIHSGESSIVGWMLKVDRAR